MVWIPPPELYLKKKIKKNIKKLKGENDINKHKSVIFEFRNAMQTRLERFELPTL